MVLSISNNTGKIINVYAEDTVVMKEFNENVSLQEDVINLSSTHYITSNVNYNEGRKSLCYLEYLI